ncbi:MAG: hypothetical protein K6A64_05965 [Bacteroidales bacterium]|nr:hypothetical protein [Bacteroidales bacterium]
MKKNFLSCILLLAGLTVAFAQEEVVEQTNDTTAVKASFWNNTYVQAADGLALNLSAGIGNSFEVSAGKWFNKSVGVSINYTNVAIFDGSRSFSDNLIGAGFLWNVVGKKERIGIWTPVLSPELGFMITTQQGANNSAYAAGSFYNYFRVHQNVDVLVNAKAYFGIDPHNTGRIPFITMPSGILSVGARYRF